MLQCYAGRMVNPSRWAASHSRRSFITVDPNIEYQQNVSTFAIAVLLLRARSNDIDDPLPLMRGVRGLLPSVRPGQLLHVEDR